MLSKSMLLPHGWALYVYTMFFSGQLVRCCKLFVLHDFQKVATFEGSLLLDVYDKITTFNVSVAIRYFRFLKPFNCYYGN